MANLGGVQAASPRPTERCDQAGIGDAEFFPRCMAAGCSPGRADSITSEQTRSQLTVENVEEDAGRVQIGGAAGVVS
jgi:hypothetical protein